MIVVIAIKYMTAVEPEKKKGIKEALPNYFIGAVIFIGATNITYYIIVFINDIIADLNL